MEKNSNEREYKEKRIREITLLYYTRVDVKKALYEFSKNRECIPRYYEAFGKRPDTFQYESDIIEQVKKGATSFHCSEELWNDPLELSTEMSRPELNNLRIGWDLLIDIDSPYLEYSKIYTNLVIELLKFHGLGNIGVKYSGNKGFHIIIPWKAFPKEIYNEKTKDMFPEWPRIICQYVSEIIKPKLSEKIFEKGFKEIAEKTGKKEEELVIDECLSCHRKATKKYEITWKCINCKLREIIRIDNKRIQKCPECRKLLKEISRREVLFCEYCKINSVKNPDKFIKSKEKTETLINADLVLVSSRHLFRMPFALHEKTALSSVVIDKNKISDFQLTYANPLKITIQNYYPNAKENEARELLLSAFNWNEQRENEEISFKSSVLSENYQKKDFKKIIIQNPSIEIFPPQIKLILNGIRQDGRKRALFILISFFRSLGVLDDEIERRIYEWNEKNYLPLKKGYIKSQIDWYKRNPNRLPPNFDNPIYKDLGVDKPDELSLKTKNPVTYAIKKYFQLKR